MGHALGVDWGTLFVPHTPVPEILIRGSITYIMLFALLRLGPKREAGAAGLTDILLVVLIADAVQNAMAGGYTSITDGLILVSTIIFWSWMLNWCAFRFRTVERIVMGPPLPLIRNGRMLRKHMARELISEEELMSQLRLQGVENVSDVQSAWIEPDGRISVITGAQQDRGSPERRVS